MPFSQQQAERICKLIAEDGLTLRQVAEKEDISAALILYHANKDASFAEQYARAVQLRADHDFEALIDLADEKPAATLHGIDSAWVNWQRLRIDTRKWALSKRNPKKYGDKTELTGDLNVSVKRVVSDI